MMPRHRLRLFGGAMLLTAGVVVTVIACGPGDLSRLTKGEQTAPTEPVPTSDPTDPCTHARPPKKPGTTIGDDKVPLIILAAEDIRIDTSGGQATEPPQSLDLDNKCSCIFDAGQSCVLPTGAASPPCDLDGGRDNVTGPLIEFGSTLITTLKPDYLRDRIVKGYYSVIITIGGWNGTDNDDRVAVALYMSAGLAPSEDPLARPNFDGNDTWTVEQGSVLNGEQFVDQNCDGALNCPAIAGDIDAYVSGGTVVAHFPTVPFAFGAGDGRISIPFQSATLVGKLTASEETGTKVYHASAELVGRWPAEDIIKAVSRINLSTSDSGAPDVSAVCANPQVFGIFKQRVCTSVDLALNEADDGKGKKCMAMSQAVGIKAVQAKLGIIRASKAETGAEKCPTDLDTSCGF